MDEHFSYKLALNWAFADCKLSTTQFATIYLREIANKMTAFIIHLRHDIEEKRFDIIVQRLMVQEHFRNKTQILTVHLFAKMLAIHGRLF
jgi:hypothetical protein